MSESLDEYRHRMNENDRLGFDPKYKACEHMAWGTGWCLFCISKLIDENAKLKEAIKDLLKIDCVVDRLWFDAVESAAVSRAKALIEPK